MFCVKCGMKLKDDAVYCTKCGTKIKREAVHVDMESTIEERNVNHTEAAGRKNSRAKIIILAVVLVIVVAAAVIIGMKLYKESSAQREEENEKEAIETEATIESDGNVEASEEDNTEDSVTDNVENNAEDTSASELLDWKQLYIAYFANSDEKIMESKLIKVEALEAPLLAYSVDEGSVGHHILYIDKEGTVEDSWYYSSKTTARYNKAGEIIFTTESSVDTAFQVFQYDNNTGKYASVQDGSATANVPGEPESGYNYEIDGTECDADTYNSAYETWNTAEGYTDIQLEIEVLPTGSSIIDVINNYMEADTSKSEDENLAAKLEQEIIPAYEKYVSENFTEVSGKPYSFIFLNDDEIPELVVEGNCEATGNMICTYINGAVVSMNTQRLSFSFIERGNLLCNSSGNMGYYYDIVSSIGDKEFICVAEGDWSEGRDDETENLVYEYFWDGQQVSEEEYQRLLMQVFDNEKATSNYDLTFYSSIQEAYENIGKSLFSTWSTDVIRFELVQGVLTVETEDGSTITYPVADDCAWDQMSVGMDEPDGAWTYDELKAYVDEVRSYYLEYGEYDSPGALQIEIKDGVIVRIYTIFS